MSPNPAILTWPRPVAGGGGGALSAAYVTHRTDIANASTYTFTGVDIGTPSSDRTVLVVFHARAVGVSSITSITIGGNPATIDTAHYRTDSLTGFARLAVPSGTSATVVVTLPGSAVRAGLGVWAITGGPIALAATADSDTSPLSVTVPTDGVGIAAVTSGFTGIAVDSADYAVRIGTENGWIAGGRVASSPVAFVGTQGAYATYEPA